MKQLLISTCVCLALLTQPDSEQAQEKQPPKHGVRAQLSVEAELIRRASGWPWQDESSTGLDVIRAVNALQRLGKGLALERLEEYLESVPAHASDERQIVFWIVRLLFEPADPAQRIPSPAIAVYLLEHDSPDRRLWPLEPLELVNDIPFLVGRRIGLGGQEEHPITHVDWARRNGIIRPAPLAPSMAPLAAAELLLSSPKFKRLDDWTGSQGVDFIRLQSQRMLPTVPKIPPELNDRSDTKGREAANNEHWKTLLAQERKQKRTWDPKAEQFVSQLK